MFPKVKSTGYGNVGLSSFFPNLLRDIPTSLLHSTNPGWWAEVPLNFEHPPAFITFYLKLNEQLLGFQHHNFCRRKPPDLILSAMTEFSMIYAGKE